jgi:hypothetical protein
VSSPLRLLPWVALGIVGSLLILPLLSATASANNWTVFVAQDHVTIGQAAEISVFGPPDTPFVVSVTPPPWNGVPPVFSGEFRTSNTTYGGVGHVNVSIPTAPLFQAEYAVSLSVAGVTVNTSNLWLVPSVNDSYLNNSFNQFLQNWVIEQTIVQNLREQLASEAQGRTTDRYVMVAFGIGVVLWLAHTWRLRTSARYLSRTRDWWHDKMHGPSRETIPSDENDDAWMAPRTVPGAWFVGRWRCCSRKPWLESSLVAHIRLRHSTDVGSAGPRAGRDYFVSATFRADALRHARPIPRHLSLDEREQRRRTGVDLTEVLGR